MAATAIGAAMTYSYEMSLRDYAQAQRRRGPTGSGYT